MMNATRTQTPLGNLEAPAAAQDDIAFGNAHVVELDMHVSVWRVVVAENAHGPHDFHARCVLRHENLGLAIMPRRVGGL